jgi:hypothetical protein
VKPLPLACALVALTASMAAAIACHPGPVISTGPKQPAGGTISGMVSTDTNAGISGRKVTAIETETGARFEATTSVNGGYTIKVPEGLYRIEVELKPGESVAKQPEQTRINRSDLDPRRDFVITLAKL